ncbi:MAG: divalent-cation tolerance protein CutA [Halothiobacillaceae bacterium]|nr:divalent-cation tolerance protein CutA [Halothiobacillaceae bacterium]HER19410.1 divalent-cation tolerance protein CutA [Chromatiales bacterium]
MTIEQSTIALVITTLDDPEVADEFSSRLLTEGLIACANRIGPIHSVYHWQGELCRDEEYQIHMKTRPERLDDLKDAIERHHPYDCPEVLILTAGSSQLYSEWVQQCVQTAR